MRGDVKTDVLIIGGGITGILCAKMLADAGIDYILAEASEICSGITKNTTAKITSQHGLIYSKLRSKLGTERARMYLEANRAAISKFREMCGGIDCDFEEKDSYVYSLDDRNSIELELRALDELGFSAQFERELPLPFSSACAVKFTGQAQFNPLKFIAAIAPGLNIYENTPVTELKKLTAVTPGGTIRAKSIIVATHFPFINKHGSYFLKLYQHRSYVIGLENAPCLGGMYVDAQEGGMSFRNYDGLLLLGGNGHRTGSETKAWRGLEAFAKEHYPGSGVKYRWATQDCMTLDGSAYIGRYSARTPDMYVATGYNKWGMTTSMVAATILTDMITGKENPHAEAFSPSRSIMTPQLAVNGFEAVKNLLSISAKRCPHLGCALKWNPHEHTWDCPCHGSRFTEDGRLIDNPSTGNLDGVDGR